MKQLTYDDLMTGGVIGTDIKCGSATQVFTRHCFIVVISSLLQYLKGVNPSFFFKLSVLYHQSLLFIRESFIFYFVYYTVSIKKSFLILHPTDALDFNILFIQYSSVICRPSDHTVGGPRSRCRNTNPQTTTPPL